jgi:nicotinate-nucleotide pyrophosphorylase
LFNSSAIFDTSILAPEDDIGNGGRDNPATVEENKQIEGSFIAKRRTGVICGLPVVSPYSAAGSFGFS